ncbi:MAG: C4-dicarboxylate ABC transporter substrate-binding protein, partial [Pseudomonadota bacterium]
MKRFLFLAVCLVLIFALPATTFAGPKVRWKVGTLAPKGVGYAKQVEDVLTPLLNETTGGGLELKVYWGGVMGDDEDHIKKMRIGQLQ